MFNRKIFKKKEDKEKVVEEEKKSICQNKCERIIENRREDREREDRVKKMLDELDRKEKEKRELQKMIELQGQEEWVYVEGIKGMTKDMKMILNM